MLNAGGELYSCKATVDMFHLKKQDFFKEVDGISVGQFHESAAGGQIISHDKATGVVSLSPERGERLAAVQV